MSKLGLLRGLATKEGQAMDKSLLTGPCTGAATRHCQTELYYLEVCTGMADTHVSVIAGGGGGGRNIQKRHCFSQIYITVQVF